VYDITAVAENTDAIDDAALADIADLVRGGDVLVLSGAGLSTESGIPDYRGPTGVLRNSLPMTYQTFTRDPLARRRYWARSQLGWRHLMDAEPNLGHSAVAELEALGALTGIVTQNVDGLHQAGGARSVVELHGSVDRVVCIRCGDRTPRSVLSERLRAANPAWEASAAAVNPDGDVSLAEADLERFRIVDCRRCAGMLKPDVIFFGENVPPVTVELCYRLVDRCRSMLVLGSSLTVMSGLRFVRRAAASGRPVAIVTQGVTRADELASIKVDLPLGETLRGLVDSVARQR